MQPEGNISTFASILKAIDQSIISLFFFCARLFQCGRKLKSKKMINIYEQKTLLNVGKSQLGIPNFIKFYFCFASTYHKNLICFNQTFKNFNFWGPVWGKLLRGASKFCRVSSFYFIHNKNLIRSITNIFNLFGAFWENFSYDSPIFRRALVVTYDGTKFELSWFNGLVLDIEPDRRRNNEEKKSKK